MTLEIFLEQSKVTLKLLNKRGPLDTQELKYYHDLENVLISGLDKLLKKNRMSPKALKTYKIQGDLGPMRPSCRALGKDSTSYKIAFAFLAALKIGYNHYGS